MSSPDVREVEKEFSFDKVQVYEDPFWPPVGYVFPVSPAEMHDWATLIFNASNFLGLFEDK